MSFKSLAPVFNKAALVSDVALAITTLTLGALVVAGTVSLSPLAAGLIITALGLHQVSDLLERVGKNNPKPPQA